MLSPFPKCTSDSPWLEQPEVQLLLQTVINVLLPPRIISTSRSKNFMLESSPAHCSTPGDAGKDLRKEGLAESTSQAAYLGGSLFPCLLFFTPHGCTYYDLSGLRRYLKKPLEQETLLCGWFTSVNPCQKTKSVFTYEISELLGCLRKMSRVYEEGLPLSDWRQDHSDLAAAVR